MSVVRIKFRFGDRRLHLLNFFYGAFNNHREMKVQLSPPPFNDSIDVEVGDHHIDWTWFNSLPYVADIQQLPATWIGSRHKALVRELIAQLAAEEGGTR